MAAVAFEEFRNELNQQVLKEFSDDINKRDIEVCVKKTLKGVEDRIKPMLGTVTTIDVRYSLN